MEDFFYSLLSNRQATFVNMVIGVLLFIALLFLFFCKSSRDERGRKIIGKSEYRGIDLFWYLCYAIQPVYAVYCCSAIIWWTLR